MGEIAKKECSRSLTKRSIFLCTAFISLVSCVPPPTSQLTPSNLKEAVLQSINAWQNQSGVGVTAGVKTIVADEYLFSLENCQSDPISIKRSDIEFYVFHYLDQARGEGVYSPHIVCNPFNQSGGRKIKKYGNLRVESDRGNYVLVDSERFDENFRDFLITVGKHNVSVESGTVTECDNMVSINSGKTTRVECLAVR